jgi:hypothetical protein
MRYLSVILLFISVSSSFGQSLEWEILNLGVPFGFQKNKEGAVVLAQDKGAFLGTEVRYNFCGKKISSGIQISFTGWNKTYPGTESDAMRHQNPFIFLAVTDYNFLELSYPKIVPFVGVGLGYSVIRSRGLFSEGDNDLASHLACSPRFGAEFFKRIRLTGEYQYIGNYNSFFNIKLGFVIGS